MSDSARADNFSTPRRFAAHILRTYVEALNAGDMATLLDCLDDNVIHDVNQGERRKGKDRFEAFIARQRHYYRETLCDPVVMVSRDGTRAALEYNIEGVYLETEQGLPPAHQQRYVLPGGTFFAIGEAKIERVTTYYNMTDWLTQIAG